MTSELLKVVQRYCVLQTNNKFTFKNTSPISHGYMSYYERLLTEISMPEKAVDCGRCTDLYKCCTYRPFIANFLVGQMGDALLQFDLKEWDLTICGLSPAMTYRKQFKAKGSWGFGTDATLLCTFYDKKSGGCNVWQNRPGVCRTFFCKSTYEQGLEYWKLCEELMWYTEWVLLEDFLYTEGWTLEEVGAVKGYLHENAVGGVVKCPEGTLFTEIHSALNFYKRASEYIHSLSEEATREILGEKALVMREQILALKANLR